ncbi:hypothetical protein GCM10022397_04860 [Flavivirga jejuensis]
MKKRQWLGGTTEESLEINNKDSSLCSDYSKPIDFIEEVVLNYLDLHYYL